MREQNREFAIDYYDGSVSDKMYDVSFELRDEVADKLITQFGWYIGDKISDGILPQHELHMAKRIIDQRVTEPPWMEDDERRVYDLELTVGDYRVLTSMVGHAMQNVLTPDGADPYAEMVDMWVNVTAQLLEEMDE